MATDLLRSVFELAFADYTAVLPIHFVEVIDRGPLPQTGEYEPTGLANIRIGQVPHIDDANAYAYFPYSASSGLAGDVVFNANRFGFNWTPTLFYAVAQHELGHTLGMGHIVDDDSAAVAVLAGAPYDGSLIALAFDMVTALQSVYGAGVGSVTPLAAVPEAETWLLLSIGLGLVITCARRRRRHDHA